MRYVIMSLVTLGTALLVGWLVAGSFARRRGHTISKPQQALLSLCFAALVVAAGVATMLVRSYRANAAAKGTLVSDSEVEVSAVEGGYLFDGEGEQSALVFLPGANVETEAYAPLMHELAAQGVDCLLVDVPLKFAFLGKPTMESLMEAHPYEHFILAGHSLGGVVASSYASEQPDVADGLVLLAAYPTSRLPDSLAFCSIIASEDGLLSEDAYDQGRSLWPPDSNELVIEGGNHAGFGSYGTQAGDGIPFISAREQRLQTSAAIVELVRHIEEES